MIPVQQERELVSGGVKGSSSFDISHENVAHILTILRDTLYSDKIMAVLREYGANAWDANRQAGKADVPIKVHVPTLVDPTLRIRDYGPGLSVEDVERIFTKYGASTKREDNLAVGMLGIGSKSGFAYSDSFSVTSWHGGWRREYVAVIDASQKGKMDLLYEVRQDEPAETGVEIGIAVKSTDIRDFEVRAQRLFMHYVPRPVINTTLPVLQAGKDLGTMGRIYESSDWGDRGKWTAVMGCVPYRIDLAQLGRVTIDGVQYSLAPCANNIGGTVYFDIGELQVAASREELKYGDPTKRTLIERINGIIDEFVRIMLKDLDKLTEWERRLRVKEVDQKGLPLPKDTNDYRATYIELKSTVGSDGKPMYVKMSSRNYNGVQTDSRTLRIERASRLVIKDDKRTVKGFTGLTNTDVLVSPTAGTSHVQMMSEVRRIIATHRITGIPVVMLSTFAWTAPPKGTPGHRDPAKAKAQCLLLNPTSPDLGATPLSQHWDPASIRPSDQDVWVILDSYRVNSYVGPTGDFYEQYNADRHLVLQVGLKMPPVIGYRSTKDRPVIASKLKGSDYGEWRKKGLVELLRTHPDVARVADAMEVNEGSGYDMALDSIVNRLGEKHPISLYAKRVNGARAVVGKADAKVLKVAKYVRATVADANLAIHKLRKELTDAYPLLRTTNLEAAFASYGSNRELWLDYVQLIDSNVEAKKDKKEEEEKAA